MGKFANFPALGSFSKLARASVSAREVSPNVSAKATHQKSFIAHTPTERVNARDTKLPKRRAERKAVGVWRREADAPSCILCKASSTVRSEVITSGRGVMMSETKSLHTQRSNSDHAVCRFFFLFLATREKRQPARARVLGDFGGGLLKREFERKR